MDMVIQPTGGLRGTVTVPGDKSISHRAVMIGALAEGETLIYNFLPGEDCLSTINCFRKLGVVIEGPAEGMVRVIGRGLAGLQEPGDVLDAGNSGTTMRLALGILAGQKFFSVITGDDSLRRRPMARVTEPLRLMGAHIEGRQGGRLAPLAVHGGKLRPICYNSPVASAQVKSAVLFAGLFAQGDTVVSEPHRSRDHTERMLRHFGADLEADDKSVRVKGLPRLTGQVIKVPGDISSAAFLLVAACVSPGSDLTITGVGLNPARSGIIDALSEMGADITLQNLREEGGEPVGDIRVRSAVKLTGVKLGGEIIPRLIDEVPVLAVAAALAEGKTEIRDAAELKVKESNRIASTARLLSGFGASVEELADGLSIKGVRSLNGCACESGGDHRIAMAAAVAGLLASGQTLVRGSDCIDISFPGFKNVLESISL
ncbi:MAG: 3-phosphoshikimate 1-carboxyvinyltransferase [Peptococcaceae bacterium]|nr:3-phosphoshikimate 1-carboxyvinyltransferase [Peptococcaceae bacterium]